MVDPILEQLLVKLANAEAVWFSSTRPDGRAHLAPIWHVWHEGCIYVVTHAQAVRSHNIAHNPNVSIALPDPMDVLIIEGEAAPVAENDTELQPLFLKKYGWDIETDMEYNLIIRIAPRKIMAWGAHGEGRWQVAPDGTLRSIQHSVP